MDLSKNVPTSDLLTYSNVLEQLIDNAVSVQTQISEMVASGFATQEEVQKIFSKIAKSHEEATEKYKAVQVEIDLRMKRDLKMNFGIRKMQVTFIELDNFIVKKRQENLEKDASDLAAAQRISHETLKIVEDDKNQTSQEEQ